MFVPFESLPPTSRVWIFQADRPFAKEERADIDRRLRAFTEEWSVHGVPFDTSFTVKFDQFVILAADETEQMASGCSIDSSVRTLKDLEASLGISLFERNRVAFQTKEGIHLVPVSQLKEKFSDGTLSADTLTFNNLVATKVDLEQRWIVPAAETWLKRYIPDTVAKVS